MATWFLVILTVGALAVIGVFFWPVLIAAVVVAVAFGLYLFNTRRQSDLGTGADTQPSKQPHGAGQG